MVLRLAIEVKVIYNLQLLALVRVQLASLFARSLEQANSLMLIGMMELGQTISIVPAAMAIKRQELEHF